LIGPDASGASSAIAGVVTIIHSFTTKFEDAALPTITNQVEGKYHRMGWK